MDKGIFSWLPPPLADDDADRLLGMLPADRKSRGIDCPLDLTGEGARENLLAFIEDARCIIASAHHLGTQKVPTKKKIQADRKGLSNYRNALAAVLDATANMSDRVRMIIHPKTDESSHYALQPHDLPIDIDGIYIKAFYAIDLINEKDEELALAESVTKTGGEDVVSRKVAAHLARLWTQLGGNLGETKPKKAGEPKNPDAWRFKNFVQAVGETADVNFKALTGCNQVMLRKREVSWMLRDAGIRKLSAPKPNVVNNSSYDRKSSYAEDFNPEPFADLLDVCPENVEEMHDAGITGIEMLDAAMRS